MKKFFAGLITICFVFCLCSCGKESRKMQLTTAHEATRAYEDLRLHSAANEIADGLFTGDLSDFSDEEKSMIKSYLLDRNFKIEFNDDGTANLSRAGNEWLVSNKWIKNSYTEGVPEQTIGTVTMSMESLKEKNEPEFIIMVKSNDVEDAFEKYKETLVDAGFKSTGGAIYEGDEVFEGVKDGKKHIRISLSGKGYIITIKKLLSSTN